MCEGCLKILKIKMPGKEKKKRAVQSALAKDAKKCINVNQILKRKRKLSLVFEF